MALWLFKGPLDMPDRRAVYRSRPNSTAFRIPAALAMTATYRPCTSLAGQRYANLYLVNVHQTGRTELLGFLHVENLTCGDSLPTPFYPAHYTVALAHSPDRGRSWAFLGHVIGVNNQALRYPDMSCNIGGVPYLVVDRYLYVYYNESPAGSPVQYPAVARAPLDSVAAHARRGRVSVSDWSKYAGGQWVPAWDEGAGWSLGSPVLSSPDAAWAFEMSNDAAYCAPLEAYLLTTREYGGGVTDRLCMYRSTDGVTWGQRTVIGQAGGPNTHPTYSYFASLDRDASDDCSVVGRRFSVYYFDVDYELLGRQVAEPPAVWTSLPLYRVDLSVVEGR